MIAVIYYAYGAPKSIDDIESYFSHILNGKPVPEPMLKDIESMFTKSGFPDFIRSSTERIANALQTVLSDQLNEEVRVWPAYKHTAPFVANVFEYAIQMGATTIVTLSVNPILSVNGGGAVHTEISQLVKGKDVRHIAIDNWYLDEGIVSVYADRVRRAFEWLPVAAQKSAYVLFTVHSQPINEEVNEPYVKQFNELATAIANKASIQNYKTVYRSGRKTGWLAPDVKESMTELHNAGVGGFVTCELLSISADVESFHEINAECREYANLLNASFAVSEFPSDSFDTVMALSALIQKHIHDSLLSIG